MRTHKFLLISGVALALATATPQCLGQSDARVMQLRREALDAHLRGEYARALELATRALSIAPSGSLHGIIARERLGLAGDPPDMVHLAAALDHAEVCVQETPAEPPSPNRDTVLTWCREQLTHHANAFARIVVEVPSPPPGLQVTVAGRPLVARRPGIAYVNPGRVVVEATAPGYLSLRREVDVARSASATVEMPLTRTGAPAQARMRSPIGLVVAGVGAAALVTSGVTWLYAGQMCGEDPASRSAGCYLASEQEARTVRTLDTVTTVGLVAGAGLVVTGAVLHFTLRPGVARSQPHVTVTAGLGALGLAGTF